MNGVQAWQLREAPESLGLSVQVLPDPARQNAKPEKKRARSSPPRAAAAVILDGLQWLRSWERQSTRQISVHPISRVPAGFP